MGELAVADEELWLRAVVATASVVEGGGGASPEAPRLWRKWTSPVEYLLQVDKSAGGSAGGRTERTLLVVVGVLFQRWLRTTVKTHTD